MDFKDFVSPDLPSKCAWHVGCDPKTNPHSKHINKYQKIYPDILHVIGNTPMVKLNVLPKSLGLKCDVFAKCEFFNPGGSVKDRIGYRMILDAETKGLLKPGDTVIEPTSGNTGIGIALGCAIKGYKCIIVMPEKMSHEKFDVLKALGAEVVRTPTEAAFDSPHGLIFVSQKLQKETPNSIILDQYRNAGNPLAHYDTTAQEIYDQCDGKIDMIVSGVGTGGTVTAIGRKMKELCPSCIIVAADPEHSILAHPENPKEKTESSYYEVEGIGYDFVATVLDRNIVDKWCKINDKVSFTLARRLIREEGLLCGGSSGAAMSAVVQAAKDLEEGQRCVVILPDGVRNYMTKFLSDQWMEVRHLKECKNIFGHWWWNEKVSKLILNKPKAILSTATGSLVLGMMQEYNCEELPVTDDKGILIGMITSAIILNSLVEGKIVSNDSIEEVMIKHFPTATKDTCLGLVSRTLEVESFLAVVEDENAKEQIVTGIITKMNLLKYITGNDKNLNGIDSSKI